MILMEFLFAPTVPSPPRPQNLHSMVPAAAVLGADGVLGQGQVGDVVDDADGEARLGIVLGQLVVDGERSDAGGVSLEPRP